MMFFRKTLLPLLLPAILTGCMSGPDFSARFSGRSEKAWKDAFLAARMSEQRGDLMRASAAYEELLSKYPEKAATHHRLGILCQKNGRQEEAIQHLTRAHQIAPMDIEVLCDLGYIHFLQNRPKDAVEALQKAQQINPGHERTQANLAVALIALNQVPSAVALLRQNMGEAPAATMVGFALAQQGEFDQAKKYFNQALEADATNQPAAEALVQIEQMLNKQQQVEMPAEVDSDTGVVAAGQMAALPFEVIAEGVVSKPALTTENAAARPTAEVHAVRQVSGNKSDVAEVQERPQVAALSASGSSRRHALPSPRMAAAENSDSPQADPGLQENNLHAEKKIKSSLTDDTRGDSASRAAFAADANDSQLPPVDSTDSFKPRRQRDAVSDPRTGLSSQSQNRTAPAEGAHANLGSPKTKRSEGNVWRSAASRISIAGFSEPISSIGNLSDAAVLSEATELPPVDSQDTVITLAASGGPRRTLPAPLARIPPEDSRRVSMGQASDDAPATVSGSLTAETKIRAAVASNVTPLTLPVVAAGTAPAATNTVGGLPLLVLRTVYVQLSEDQKATFWKDMRKQSNPVPDAELAIYRDLARSTENLARVEAAITLLAVFSEEKLAAELLGDLDKHSDPIVRHAASVASSMLQIQLRGPADH